jgi:hypothetical protein
MFEMAMRTIQIGFSSQDQVLYEDADYRLETAVNWRETAQQIAAGETLRALSSISYHYCLLQRCLAKRQATNKDELSKTPLGTAAAAHRMPATDFPVFDHGETRPEE